MKKSEFRELIKDNMNQFGKTIKIGKVIFNAGMIYSPTMDDNRGVYYFHTENMVNYLWRKAKQNKSIVCGSSTINL